MLEGMKQTITQLDEDAATRFWNKFGGMRVSSIVIIVLYSFSITEQPQVLLYKID